MYVGKIAPSVEDKFFRMLLEHCGHVSHWRRVKDAVSGDLKAFGFCTYSDRASAIRAIKILNGFPLDGQELLLKVDEKTQMALSEYSVLEDPELMTDDDGESLDEKALKRIKKLLDERSAGDLKLPGGGGGGKSSRLRKGDDDEDFNVEESMMIAGNQMTAKSANIVNSEIQRFRIVQAQREAAKKEELNSNLSKGTGETYVDEEWDKIQREKERTRAKVREQRRRDRERESRKRERDGRTFRERLRRFERWESERLRDVDREDRVKQQHREDQLDKESSYDFEFDMEQRRASSRRKRAREREETDDAMDVQKEKEEEDLKRWEAEQEAARVEEQRAAAQREREAAKEAIRSTKLTLGSSSRMVVAPGFQVAEDEEEVVHKKKLVLVERFKTEEELQREKEEKARQREEAMKRIIAEIPVDKDALFALDINWSVVSSARVIEEKMRPWVTKKVVEYLGEEEKSFISFILSTLEQHQPPQQIQQQLKMVLEDESETFVLKMWRILAVHAAVAALEEEQQ